MHWKQRTCLQAHAYCTPPTHTAIGYATGAGGAIAKK